MIGERRARKKGEVREGTRKGREGGKGERVRRRDGREEIRETDLIPSYH